MITAYYQTSSGIQYKQLTAEEIKLLDDALWIDMLSPTKEEEQLIEKNFNINVPTKKEMEEIEPSSRLYQVDHVLFMTATMVAKSNTPEPKSDAVTFILTEKKLITIRYIEPQAFNVFIWQLLRAYQKNYDAEKILLELLDSTTNRLADILEMLSHQFDEISNTIFHQNGETPSKGANYKLILQNIGSNGDLGARARESLVSFNRLVYFLDQTCGTKFDTEKHLLLTIVTKDINALSDYASFISNKVNFLLDATLGMVNIEQNNIIKIFSVAAVIFLPPTLIASIYGMNFQHMPELHWFIGYPIAIILMIISAWLPYKYFKSRKWL